MPALIAVPGVVYPGPPALGDARALRGFLLQRQLYQPGDPERTGWIMFAGQEFKRGCTIEIDVDLGRGPRRTRFRLPTELNRSFSVMVDSVLWWLQLLHHFEVRPKLKTAVKLL